jgi:ABC-type phosphate/phosphonate transport system ATPase subunit
MIKDELKGKTDTDNASAPQTNIWKDILREAMTKKDLEDSHVFIFGDKFAGKRSLIRIINKELLQKGETEGNQIYY